VGQVPIRGTPKEKRQYKKIKESAKKEGRYKGREEEVAARTVMKQRSQKKKIGARMGGTKKR
jgi:hypothetical protein